VKTTGRLRKRKKSQKGKNVGRPAKRTSEKKGRGGDARSGEFVLELKTRKKKNARKCEGTKRSVVRKVRLD